MSNPSTNSLPQDAFTPQFEHAFVNWVKNENFAYTFTDEDIEARRWVLKHDGASPPHFQAPHNSWLTKVRKQHRLGENGEEVLYRPSPEGDQWYKLVPISQVLTVIKRVHCLQTAHSGQNKTHEEIARYYRGVGKKEVVKAIKSCNICMLKILVKSNPSRPAFPLSVSKSILLICAQWSVKSEQKQCAGYAILRTILQSIHRWADGLPHVIRSINFTRHSATLHTPYRAVFGRKPREIDMWDTLEGRDIVEEVRLDDGRTAIEDDEEDNEGTPLPFRWEDQEDETETPQEGQGSNPQTTLETTPLQSPAEPSSTNPVQQLIMEDEHARRNPTASDHIITKMRERQALCRAKMVEQHGRNQKNWTYKTGDKVTLFVPPQDRPGAPASRIPCVVCEVVPEKSNTYRLLCSEGVLTRLYQSKVLNPADDLQIPVSLHLGWSKWNTFPQVTLREAAYKIFDIKKVEVHCRCKGECTTNRCRCRQKNVKCEKEEKEDREEAGDRSTTTSMTAPSYTQAAPSLDNDTSSESDTSVQRREHRRANTPWPANDHSLESWSDYDEDGVPSSFWHGRSPLDEFPNYIATPDELWREESWEIDGQVWSLPRPLLRLARKYKIWLWHELATMIMSKRRGLNQSGFMQEAAEQKERVKRILQAREVFKEKYGAELQFDSNHVFGRIWMQALLPTSVGARAS
ncbi:hypothetical protein TREMEDRAFT_63268 [Tremella mesenterica DSM 1558]|uniref:uncharacterized protein n=1 Tax=Tremella mesenterica (strain ATCC 24925 / CBS 8224 / DSM 1558 / NBRC 9311 / NRRL Y-6157 / RJB 2259-6 / UBC 559-6) TaxID=578456 RepID=UPI0003F4A273|nr:uncharacterized protein TREMEDRAFT_63268 [Tremella mesenterica DSM 1558]EIW68804.1 hypothetical protein TREMEDRAFT_63268 [Tremella mesenterica DSM 1558]